MNNITKMEIERRGEKVLQECDEKTFCPRCEKKNATFLKTTNLIILDCPDCDFSMGSPREV